MTFPPHWGCVYVYKRKSDDDTVVHVSARVINVISPQIPIAITSYYNIVCVLQSVGKFEFNSTLFSFSRTLLK